MLTLNILSVTQLNHNHMSFFTNFLFFTFIIIFTPLTLKRSPQCILKVSWKGISRYSQTPLYRLSLNTDTSLTRTVCFVPGKRKSSGSRFFLNSTRLIRTLSMAPSVSILTGFDCNYLSIVSACKEFKGILASTKRGLQRVRERDECVCQWEKTIIKSF